MPAPSAPTGLALTPKGTGIGAATLAWTHAGTTKYEVLFKRPYDESWKTLYLAPAGAFGASSPYEMEVPLTDDIQFTVKAINSSGESSAKATPVTSTVDVVGIWFLPMLFNQISDDDWAWIGGESPALATERDGKLLTVPFRSDELNLTTGKVRLYKGKAQGTILTKFGVSGDVWLGRLERLFREQKTYRWVWLSSARWMFKVELDKGVSIKTVIASGRAYEISIDVRELPDRFGG